MNYGTHPAVIQSYDPAKKTCMVEIPGITDGGTVEAEISFPVGDKSEHTDIRILPGDRCWVEFVGGDARYPLIIGFRPKHTGNVVDYRRWHHKHIETDADETQKHTAGTTYRIEATESATVIVGSTEIFLEPNKITQTVGSTVITIEGSKVTIVAGGQTATFDSFGFKTTGDVMGGSTGITLLTHKTSGVTVGIDQSDVPVPG